MSQVMSSAARMEPFATLWGACKMSPWQRVLANDGAQSCVDARGVLVFVFVRVGPLLAVVL